MECGVTEENLRIFSIMCLTIAPSDFVGHMYHISPQIVFELIIQITLDHIRSEYLQLPVAGS